jgi:ribosome biogenesis GTPase A
MDLANEKKTLSIVKELKESHLQETKQPLETLHLSTKKNVNVQKLLSFVKSNVSPQFKTVGAWIMIAGIPNVGKSTIINSLR